MRPEIKALQFHQFQIKAFGEIHSLYFSIDYYTFNDKVAIALYTIEGEPFADLTINIPEVSLKEGEVIIKNWSENEEIAPEVFKTGLFIDTGKTVQTGFVQAPIWKIKPQKEVLL